MKTYSTLLIEYLSTGLLSEKERIKIHLIEKYYNKCSNELKLELDKLHNKGKERFSNILASELSNNRNSFLYHVKGRVKW